MELDTLNQQAKVTIDKFFQYTAVLEDTLQKYQVSLRELESLVGKISFAASVIPARQFLCWTTDHIYPVSKP